MLRYIKYARKVNLKNNGLKEKMWQEVKLGHHGKFPSQPELEHIIGRYSIIIDW